MSALAQKPIFSKMRTVLYPKEYEKKLIVSDPIIDTPYLPIEPPQWMRPVEDEEVPNTLTAIPEKIKQEEVEKSVENSEISLEAQMIDAIQSEETFTKLESMNSHTAIASSPSAKESSPLGFTIEKPGIDQVPGVQYVESEPHEMSPELEAYISKVENHQDQLPSEVVITNPAGIQPATHYAAKPVIVLPITPQLEKNGSHKATSFSIRWLVEWSRKVMKMFHGEAVYKETV